MKDKIFNLIKKTNNYDLVNNLFVEACEIGDLELVKYLSCSDELYTNVDIEEVGINSLDFAMYNNHLEIVKFLLTSVDLEKKVDIRDDYDVLNNINIEHKKIIDLLLTDKFFPHFLKEKIFNELLIKQVLCDKLEVFKYTLSLRSNFKIEIEVFQFLERRKEILNYLIYEYNLKLKDDLKGMVYNKYPEIYQLFEQRELNKKLNKDLPVKQTTKKTFKI